MSDPDLILAARAFLMSVCLLARRGAELLGRIALRCEARYNTLTEAARG